MKMIRMKSTIRLTLARLALLTLLMCVVYPLLLIGISGSLRYIGAMGLNQHLSAYLADKDARFMLIVSVAIGTPILLACVFLGGYVCKMQYYEDSIGGNPSGRWN